MIKKFYIFLLIFIHSLTYKPKKVRLDICNLCQLDCAKCWLRTNEKIIKEENGGFGYINFETFKNFVDKNNFIKEIEISNNGEVFLNPDFNKIIEYACSKNIILTAWNGVNMNFLTEEMAENLVKYKFRHITVSIDGASPEIYSIYRRKGDFNKVIENIKLINKYKEKYNSIYPELTYKFIVFGHNEHEIDKAKELAKNLNMDIEIAPNCILEYSPNKNIKTVEDETKMLDLKKHDISLYLNARKDKTKWFYCKNLFEDPVINFNGELLGCCYLYSDSFKINVFKTGLLKALRNPKVIKAKLMLYDFDFYNKTLKNIPCLNCIVYKELKKYNYSIKNILNLKF